VHACGTRDVVVKAPATIREPWLAAGLRAARPLLRRPARAFRRKVLPRLMPAADGAMRADLGSSIRVVGLLSSASGLGASARLCMEMLDAARYPVTGHDVAPLFDSDDGLTPPGGTVGRDLRSGLSIYHLNPPMLLPGILASGLCAYRRGCNVGYWAWELEWLPAEWVQALRFVHAVLVPSRFCRDAVRRHTDKPVLVVPHPVRRPPDDPGGRADLAASAPFRVISIFRLGSSFERKNPIALVRAFRTAFGDDGGARLVLKTSDGTRYRAEKAQLLREIGGAPNVELIDEVWDEARVDALMRAADLYASLHRSEGFGLPLAEAMMREVPVLATAWSGNTDFCSPDHSFAVDYTLVEFRDRHPDYDEVGRARWAEPSVAHAAAQLTLARRDPLAARNRAAAAKRALCRYLDAFSYSRAVQALQPGGALADSSPVVAAPERRLAR
jgi:glycosyltransferase involved in cell wall biosynthesis